MGEYCQHRDPCEKNRCQNGGTCVTQAMLGKATCRCAPGFTGEDCQYSTSHPCFVSRPCQNGGTCHMLGQDTYECTCQAGFTGMWFPCLQCPVLGAVSPQCRTLGQPLLTAVVEHLDHSRSERPEEGYTVARQAWGAGPSPVRRLAGQFQPQIGSPSAHGLPSSLCFLQQGLRLLTVL